MSRDRQGLLIVAGQGSYPVLLAQGARAAGVSPIVVLALRGQARRELASLADEVRRLGVGEVEKGLEWALGTGVRRAVLAGQVTPAALFGGRFDRTARALLDGLPVKSAHTIFGAVARLLEEHGLCVLPASVYMERQIPEAGVLTRRAPDPREVADIEHGHRAARSLGTLDVGQTVVVRDGMVLAMEAFEGTNRTILRGGRLCRRGAVVVKVAREGHDMRFDIPVIGAGTLPVLRRARIGALAFQANRTIFLDRERVLAAADRMGLAVVSLDSGLPPAPTRPEAPRRDEG